MAKIRMSKEQRERAESVALSVSQRIPNGPAAGELHMAYQGYNEDLLLAVHLILTDPDHINASDKLSA